MMKAGRLKVTIQVSGWMLGLLAVAGCDTSPLDLLKPKDAASRTPAVATPTPLEGADIEAPEVFEAEETALWDGRPSLGGIWIAAPGVKDPERVIIRNVTNGKLVIGALFRRERENPGPRLQLSSDAAQAIGALAGAPVDVRVTALRKQVTPAIPDLPASSAAAADTADPAPVTSRTLDTSATADTIGISPPPRAEPSTDQAVSQGSATSLPVPLWLSGQRNADTPDGLTQTQDDTISSSLAKPFLLAGSYDNQTSADAAITTLRAAGVNAIISKPSQTRNTWRVLAGPARNAQARRVLSDTLIAAGIANPTPVIN